PGVGLEHLHVAEAPGLEPECLGHRLLCTEAGREVLARAGAGGGIQSLGICEQSLGQTRAALERPLEPLDVQEIDADRRHSTVTVFARLRGWSMFSPRRRAMW